MTSLSSISDSLPAASFVPSVPDQSVNLNRMLIGKWMIYKYQWDLQVPFLMSQIEFFEDGTFQSEGAYFGGKVGGFTIDEQKLTVIMDTEDGITQWRGTIRNNSLQLKCDITGRTNYLTLLKEV